MTTEPYLLLAEDDETDVFLLRRAFRDADVRHPLELAHDGQEAIDLLKAVCARPAGQDRLPALVILDLKMPRRTGMEVLRWMRSEPVLDCLPAAIFSSSPRQEDIEEAYVQGANAFFVKPPSTAERAELARFFKDWLRLNRMPVAANVGYRAARALRSDRLERGPEAPRV